MKIGSKTTLKMLLLSVGCNFLIFSLPALAGYTKCKSLDPSGSLYCFKIGDRGILVTKVAEMLRRLGYYDGNSSNKFDNKLKKSVIKFQKNYNLKLADGVIGTGTLSKMCTLAGSSKAVNDCFFEFRIGRGED